MPVSPPIEARTPHAALTRRWIAVCAFAMTLMAVADSFATRRLAAQEPEKPAANASEDEPTKRLFEREAFDRIVLKEGNQVLEVEPLKLKGRRLPENPKPTDKLVVRTLDNSSQDYEVSMRDVLEIKLFEQLILEEAAALVAANQFDAAYDYYFYLERYHGKLPETAAAVQQYLFADALHSESAGRYDQAIGLLNEVFDRNPKFPGLDEALASATRRIVDAKTAANDHRAARRLVVNLAAKFPESAAIAGMRQELENLALQRLGPARELLAAEKWPEALAAAREAVNVWPLEEGKRIWSEAHRRFPRVVVGVTLPAAHQGGDALVDWAQRRSDRLVNRRLLEFQGYGPQGGTYQCPVGEYQKQDLGSRLAFRIRADIPWSHGGGVLTAHDAARRALALADPGDAAYRADWAALFKSVAVSGVYDLEIELQRAHVHPDGMLQTVLHPWSAPPLGEESPSIGPFTIASRDDKETRYVFNPKYFALGQDQPKELIERVFIDERKAAAALRIGEIAVLDRVPPWELESLRAAKELVVEPYAVPTVHCLIPNMKKPFLARSAFRRALLYGIDRAGILQSQLLAGASPGAGQVVSGPFARGEGIDDPMGYAYNEDVAVADYEPYLAKTLVYVARCEVAAPPEPETKPGDPAVPATAKPPAKPATPAKRPPPAKVPPLVLAHPPHEIARVACRSIQRQLKAIDVVVTLQELPLGTAMSEGDFDLLYAELAIWEPVIEAQRLLGPHGPSGYCSPHLDLALRQLSLADDWKRARDKLLQVHRIAAADVAVIPLWQIADYFAYHRGLEGVGKRPAVLYQNLERWQSPPWFATEGL